MNPIDLVLQQSFPSVMVPAREPVAAMMGPGERLLVASDGVYLEVLRPWIRLVRRIARYDVQTAIPYGPASAVTELLCGPVPPALISQFLRMTRQSLPNEAGGWIVWSAVSGEFRLVPLVPLSHSPGHLVYERPVLADGESLVVDCHSHGAGAAFFSRTDNKDDLHDVKFALVLGHCDREPSAVLRLCAKGIFETVAVLPESWMHALGVEGVW
ncbi:PRTRC system protein A [Paraburkholderia gardini]|uniref:PRTRC system protein A n=1 Tax=Paraburkholderia gardini TaxID=2823469 RepID=UPI001D5B2B3F|nr:PRTRC system protein A [Paraburkholderia gardini]CAG4913803.1 hypothetical protein R69919_04131 [Paraburkholderia gardini]